MKKKVFKLTWVVGILTSIIFSSCNDSLVYPEFDSINEVNLKSVNIKDSEDSGVSLLAGQNIDAGIVSFNDLGTEIEVIYTTKDGWSLQEVHFWIGTSFSELPQTRQGNPKIGQFPYSAGNINSTVYSFIISEDDLGYTGGTMDFKVVAHASLINTSGQTETGWGSGNDLSEELATKKGSWAMFFEITISEDINEPKPEDSGSETAFAYSGIYTSNDFLKIDEDGDGKADFNRWGWSNGPLAEGNYTMDLYAAAGQSDITKGTLVGKLKVDYASGTATVTYTINAPYVLEEAQLYVGNEILARDVNSEYTVAPGQYPYNEEVSSSASHTYNVTNLNGNIYVVAHATVGGF